MEYLRECTVSDSGNQFSENPVGVLKRMLIAGVTEPPDLKIAHDELALSPRVEATSVHCEESEDPWT